MIVDHYFADEFEGNHYLCKRYTDGSYDVVDECSNQEDAQWKAMTRNRLLAKINEAYKN